MNSSLWNTFLVCFSISKMY